MTARFLHLRQALQVFQSAETTQSQEHIKPFHLYVATRLVIEGGFFPDEITPHPPLRAVREGPGWLLQSDPDAQTRGELTVFGGMKTKQIDVVVAKPGVGPVVAVSVKGTVKAYRNLVNRMEEAIGDSTNVHVMYPGLVYGFLHLMRANREDHGFNSQDAAVLADGTISPGIQRYFAALSEMAGRRFVRNDFTRYESVGLALVEAEPKGGVSVYGSFPPVDSPLRIEPFFSRLYDVYDLRFPLRAEHLPAVRRAVWATESPFFAELGRQHDQALPDILGYEARLG